MRVGKLGYVDEGVSTSKGRFWQGKVGAAMADWGRENSQHDYASHMERERIVRERTSYVKEGNGEKEIEGVTK